MTITNVTKVAVPPLYIIKRIRKPRTAAKESDGAKLLRILRALKRRKSKVVYLDRHRRETLRVPPEGNRPMMIGAEARSRARLIK